MTDMEAGRMQVLTIESTAGRTGDLLAAAQSVEARVKSLELEGFEMRHLEVRAHIVRIPDVEPEGRDNE